MPPAHAVRSEPVRRIDAEAPADAAAVEALVDAAFGSGRFAKTAERLREGARPSAGFIIRVDGQTAGSVRLWPIRVGGVSAVFLGPIAVAAAWQGQGLGADLVRSCVDHARDRGVGGVLLVGDRAYFQRFGFAPAPDVTLPGPVDRRRILWLPVGVEAVSGPTTLRR